MHTKAINISVSLLLIILSFLVFRNYNPVNAIANGDKYFNLMPYRNAIAWYNLDSSKAEAQWKIAKASICYGDVALPSEKEYYFITAEKADSRCIALEPSNNNGYTWRAAALGNITIS